MAMFKPIDFSLQPANKDFDFFQPAFTDPYDDLFDQYVMMDSFESSDDSINQMIDMSFEATTSSDSSDPTGTSSPNSSWDVRHTQIQEPWRTTLWPVDQSAALSSTVLQGNQSPFYQAAADRATISYSELHSLEGFFQPLIQTGVPPSSPPPTPSPIPSKSRTRTVSKSSQARRQMSNDRRKASRRNSLSPTMMSAARYQSNLSTFQDPLHGPQAVASGTNLQTPTRSLPLSAPPSAKVSDYDHQKHVVPKRLQTESLRWQAYDHTVLKEQTFSDTADVALSSPFADTPRQQKQYAYHQISASSGNNNYPSTPYAHEALNSIQTPPTTQPLSPSSWAPNSASGGLGFDLNFLTDLQSTPTQPWWSGSASACTTQPSPSAYQHAISLTERDASRSLMQSNFNSASSSLATQGLMINCGHSVNGQLLDGLNDANDDAAHDYFGASSSIQPFSLYTEQAPTRRSHRRHRSSTSRSPSRSPTSQPRRSSKTPRTPTTPSHHRRKSSSTTPTSASLGGGFVNFTPHDSRKILGGVAPSGSSKTKARREKEAEVKRRKLSEAAVRAVKEAGGDLGGLESVLDGC
ncbi:MAG: hypothetical protein M1812_003732 [Candelaria pacifica]|nr:MAG: hypothetical protein M1812_003732 [Candelaria pacifica]